MTQFEQLCQKAQSLNPHDRQGAILECMDDCMKSIKQAYYGRLTNNDAMEFIIGIVCCAVVADGKFNENEYPYIATLLYTRYGGDRRSYDYNYCYTYVNEISKNGDFQTTVMKYIQGMGNVNMDTKNKLITLCLLICSVDGYVSNAEKQFLLNLFK